MRRRTLLAVVPLLLLPAISRAGASGVGSFENDDALDWADECAMALSAKPVEEALSGAVSVLAKLYLQAPAGSQAIAAAEVVAAAGGRASASLPEKLSAWVKKQPKEPLLALRPLARRAVNRVAKESRSELRSLWGEGDGRLLAEWQAAVNDLLRRLGE
jgi:Domain of unknown function (DUF4259)